MEHLNTDQKANRQGSSWICTMLKSISPNTVVLTAKCIRQMRRLTAPTAIVVALTLSDTQRGLQTLSFFVFI